MLPNYNNQAILGGCISLLPVIISLLNKKRLNKYFETNFAQFYKQDTKQVSVYELKDTNGLSNDYESLLKRALEKHTTGDNRSAVAILDVILELQPDKAEAYSLRAQCLEQLGYNLDSIDDYQKTIELGENDGNQLGLLGLVYNKIGDLDNARKYLELSLKDGWNTYAPNYKMLISLNPEALDYFRKKACVEKNLLRRKKSEFADNLKPIDKEELKKGLLKQFDGLKASISLDPNNKSLLQLKDNISRLLKLHGFIENE